MSLLLAMCSSYQFRFITDGYFTSKLLSRLLPRSICELQNDLAFSWFPARSVVLESDLGWTHFEPPNELLEFQDALNFVSQK